MIYSNTNFLPNGTQARHNTSPVVVTNGNVKVEGKVYIKGDEAAREQILPQEKATADSRPSKSAAEHLLLARAASLQHTAEET